MTFPTDRSQDRPVDTASLRVADLLAYLRRHLWLAIGVPALCLAAGLGFLVLAQPVYRSEAVILPVSEEESSSQLARLAGQFGGLASLAGINLSGGASASASLATLRSKDLAARFIEREDLLPVLFQSQWDPANGQWSDEPPTLEQAVKLFDEKVRTVFEDKDTGLVVVRIDWSDPAVAAEWAAKLVAMADRGIRERAVQEAKASIGFLEQQLNGTSVVELRQALYGLMENETKKIMLANIRSEYAFRIIDPPRVSDRDDPVWPDPLLVLATMLLVGMGIVFLVAVVRAPESTA